MAEPLPPLRDVIARHGLAAKKSLGQNFLLDMNLTGKIARMAGPLKGHCVIEVGPGPGGLTRALLDEGADRVIAVERDHRCLPILEEIAAQYPGRVEIVEDDALELDEAELLGRLRIEQPVRIVSNLPYGVASQLLVKWLTGPWPPFFESLSLMFQKEVALRIVADPRTKAYGRLSVLSQWRMRPSLQFSLPAEAFTPAPKVTSAVVRFDRRDTPRGEADVRQLQAVLAAAFGQRRKMLRQSLKSVLKDVEPKLISLGIEPTARAEELTVEQFCAIARLSGNA